MTSPRMVFLGSLIAAAGFSRADLTNVYTEVGRTSLGASINGYVVLDTPAPAGGFTVNLACNNAGVIIPSSATVAEGATKKSFKITVVSGSTAVITATAGAITRKCWFRANGMPQYAEVISMSTQQKLGNANSAVSPIWGDGDGLKISADKRFVVFASPATNLVSGDTNGKVDVFIRDRILGTTKLISKPATGQSNGNSYSPAISSDGRVVAFVSEATNLVGSDTPVADIFVYGVWNGVLSQITHGDGPSYQPCVSRDGNKIAFASEATDIVFDDANGFSDVFVHNRINGTTQLISLAPGGANGASRSPSISFTGNKIAFESEASNLIPSDLNEYQDIFMRDTVAGSTVLVSIWADGTQFDGFSYSPSLCGEGTKVAFASAAPYSLPNAFTGYPALFKRTFATNGTKMLDPQYPAELSLSGDGRFVAYSTYQWKDWYYDTTNIYRLSVYDDVSNVYSNYDLAYIPWTDVSISTDGMSVICSSRRPVGVLDFNVKDDVAYIEMVPQAVSRFIVVPGPTTDSSGARVLAGSTFTAQVTATFSGPETVKIFYPEGFTGPDTVSIASGARSQTFSIAVADSQTGSNKSPELYAELKGLRTGVSFTTVPVMVNPTAENIPLSATSITGTIQIGFAAPQGGQVVTLRTGYKAANPESQTITIPAGQRSANFSISVPAVTEKKAYTLQGVYGGFVYFVQIVQG